MAPIEELPIDAVFCLTRQPTKKSQLAPWQAFRADELVGLYEVGNLIGKGGQGSVYAVKKSEGHCVRALAFKTAKIASLGARTLEGEFEAYGRIGPHENLVEVFGLVSQSGIAGLVMERADTSLKALLDRNHRAQILTSFDICGLVLDIARGLEHLHSNNWWHNGVQPSTVLAFSQPDGGFTAKLGEFGLATPVAPHPFHGTLSLNPPEAMRRYRQSQVLLDELGELEARMSQILRDERRQAQQALRAALRSSGVIVDHETPEWKAVFEEEFAGDQRVPFNAPQIAMHIGAADDEYECNAYGKNHEAQKAVLGLRDVWGLGVILLYALTGRYPTDSFYISVLDSPTRKLEQLTLWARDLERATPSWLEKEPQLLASPFCAILRGLLCRMEDRVSLDKVTLNLHGLQIDLRGPPGEKQEAVEADADVVVPGAAFEGAGEVDDGQGQDNSLDKVVGLQGPAAAPARLPVRKSSAQAAPKAKTAQNPAAAPPQIQTLHPHEVVAKGLEGEDVGPVCGTEVMRDEDGEVLIFGRANHKSRWCCALCPKAEHMSLPTMKRHHQQVHSDVQVGHFLRGPENPITSKHKSRS